MTLLGRDAPPSIETRSVFLNTSLCDSPSLRFDHLDVRTSYSSSLLPRIVSTSLPRAAAASQNVTTRGRQTRRESRLCLVSHARVARFTGKGLWPSEARDTITSPVSQCRRGR